MLRLRDGLKIYLYADAVDMRKAISGLSGLIINEMQLNPNDSSVYIFRNKNMNRVKIVFYDRNGFVLYYKILDHKKFSRFNSQGLKYNQISIEQLDWLLAGLDLGIMQDFPEINYSYFA